MNHWRDFPCDGKSYKKWKRSKARDVGTVTIRTLCCQRNFLEENHSRIDSGHIRSGGRKCFPEHEDEGDWEQQLAPSCAPGR